MELTVTESRKRLRSKYDERLIDLRSNKLLITDRHGGEQTLRHVGNDDTDEEDYRVQPRVALNKGDDEEGNAKKYGDASDEVDEVRDLAGDWRLTCLESGCEIRNAAHYRPISRVDDHSPTGSFQQNKPNTTKLAEQPNN